MNIQPHPSIRVYALYKKFNTVEARRYSLLKLGELRTVVAFANEMRHFIQVQIPPLPNRYAVIFAVDRYPRKNSVCKKTSLLLAEALSQSLQLPLVTARYHYIKKGATEVQSAPVLNRGKKYLRKGVDIISIDDSFYTGISLKRSLAVLNLQSCLMRHFVVFKGRNKFSETMLNNIVFAKEGPNCLSKIINQRGYFFTSQMLKTIEALTPVEKKELLSAIGHTGSRRLRKAYRHHFRRSLRT